MRHAIEATLYYVIDAVKVIKPIKTETKGILSPMKDGGKDLNYYTYLRDVEYLIKYHFRWNENRKDLIMIEMKKHERILLRSMKRGVGGCILRYKRMYRIYREN